MHIALLGGYRLSPLKIRMIELLVVSPLLMVGILRSRVLSLVMASGKYNRLLIASRTPLKVHSSDAAFAAILAEILCQLEESARPLYISRIYISHDTPSYKRHKGALVPKDSDPAND